MIKIAYIIDTIESPTGGTEKQLTLLLSKLDRERFSPVLCVLRSSKWLKNEFNLCPLYTLNITSLMRPHALYRIFKFIRYLKTEKFDVIHTFFKDGMRVGITAGKIAGIPKIIAVRRSQAYWMTPFDLKITKILNRWVDLIIANSNNTRDWAANFEGVAKDKIEVIHNGIDLEPFLRNSDDNREKCRLELNIPLNAPVVCIVANLRPVKSIDVFIKSAGIVKSVCIDAHFVIVGEGELETKLRQQVCDLGLEPSVHFLGRRLDIPRLLGMADVGVLSSNSESFSNTIVEYLAAGLPVIATDVGGVREAVEDGVNGYIVQVGDYLAMADKLIKIIDCLESSNMGSNSRQKAGEYFSLQAMMNKYEKIYIDNKGTI